MTSNQQLPTIDQVREARRLLDKQDEGEAMGIIYLTPTAKSAGYE